MYLTIGLSLQKHLQAEAADDLISGIDQKTIIEKLLHDSWDWKLEKNFQSQPSK